MAVRNRWCAAAIVAAAGVVGGGQAHGAAAAAGGKSIAPQHARELQESIARCQAQLRNAGNLEEQGRLQEDLCKKLVQADDYDNALRVAAAIYGTNGLNPERRAAHHFMMARLYSKRMEASRNGGEMEMNRKRAIGVAQEVAGRGYPAAWGVTDAANGLIREMTDGRKQALVANSVAQKQTGSAPDIVRLARLQSQALQQSSAQVRQKQANGAVAFANAQPASARSLFSRATGAPAPASMKPASYGVIQMPKSGARDPRGFAYAAPAAAMPNAGRTILRSPILINGTSVQSGTAVPAAYAKSQPGKPGQVVASDEAGAAGGGIAAKANSRTDRRQARARR